MRNKRTAKIIAGALVAISMISLNPVGANAAWKKDSTGWWYTEGSSWATGWRLIDGNWYYFHGNGYMAQNESIDGYYVDSNGQWTQRKLTIDEAVNLLIKNRSAYDYVDYSRLSKSSFLREINVDSSEERVGSANLFDIIGRSESVYRFGFSGFSIYVGSISGRIYLYSGGSGAGYIDRIENGQSINIWEWHRPMI